MNLLAAVSLMTRNSARLSPFSASNAEVSNPATIPALVLIGAEDVLTPVGQSVEMARLIPDARLQVLPRGSHGMAIGYSPKTVNAVVAFPDAPGLTGATKHEDDSR